MSSTSTFIKFFLILTLIFPNFHSPVVSQTLLAPYVFQGEWQLLHDSIGISAMHMQLLSDDKVIMFDRTDFGPSNLSFPEGRCRQDPNDIVLEVDCTAHSVLYDISTNAFRPLMVQTDFWCSSGSVLPNRTLVQTGGFNDGDRHVRMFTPCFDDETCDWVEFPSYLSVRRWYSTNSILPDGRIIVVGGRRQHSYEFYPRNPDDPNFYLSFLQQTTEMNENNLYPFLHLLPDGNLFLFANTRSILLDYNKNVVVKEFPRIPGDDPRNYPSSGSSVLLPLDETEGYIEAEVMICGGASRDSFWEAINGTFIPALASCGRLKVTDENPNWVMENMPIPRVMGDMLLLPTGDVIIINGAGLGTAGWDKGREAVLTPVIFRPSEVDFQWRFRVMLPASRPRVYHSSAVLLTDGRILVGGSNPHRKYIFSNVDYPTEISLEAFAPPYLSPVFDMVRPRCMYINPEALGYNAVFYVTFKVKNYLSANELSVRLVAPSFTTHSFSMNQRMVVLKLIAVIRAAADTFYATVRGPSTAAIAPPGYYLFFLVHAGTPSRGVWVTVE